MDVGGIKGKKPIGFDSVNGSVSNQSDKVDTNRSTSVKQGPTGIVGGSDDMVAKTAVSGKQAVIVDVEDSFESKQREKVSRIRDSVRDGTYVMPDSKKLAESVLDGLSEIQSFIN